ncbi:tetratricopeptide [Aureobasidium pullulans]|uniref:Tetratricopeptide n=1 Tax=Aureobasidium pullulans TaxID=5580 RepID=A0A4V4JWC7_AURPU|nr:tetratricopeptide [Aureobasidium pullulans]
MSDSRKKLALAIIDFLNTSLKDGTLQSDDAESIEIATSCIAEAFHVDANDKTAMTAALGGQNLLSIYGVYEKLKGKSTASTEGPSSAQEGRPATPTGSTKGANEKSNAPTSESESLKAQGNAAMQKKDYATAIDYYTKALEIAPLNTIYLSNRAAAYSGASQHEFAKNDAELATAADPKYTKAWSRLGLARFALGDAQGSMEAYKAGIDAEGNGGSDAMKRGYETAKRRVEEEGGLTEESSRGAPGGGAGGMPDLSALAGMFGGGGAGGAGGQGGGMPDFASLMQNPMMQQMAQNLMKDPNMMNNLMSNPRVREMADRFGGGGAGGAGGQGGGMPDLSSLMNDPSIAEMAKNFMGGAGGAGGAGRGGR